MLIIQREYISLFRSASRIEAPKEVNVPRVRDIDSIEIT
jgi:hypothetical protein